MGQSKEDIVRIEKETEGFKTFMRVAKRIQRIDYASKWELVPDLTDPMRKFTLEREIGWARLKLGVYTEDFYHRKGDWNERYDVRPMLMITGLFADKGRVHALRLRLKITPRMAKKLIRIVNEVIIPKFYAEIEQEKNQREEAILARQAFSAELRKVAGLRYTGDRYGRNGTLERCPFDLQLSPTQVHMNGTISYDMFAEMAKHMKWGNNK